MSTFVHDMSHPEIGSIIRKRDHADTLLYQEHKPIEALNRMMGIILELEKKHRDTELYDKIRKRFNYLYNTRSSDPVSYDQKKVELRAEHCEWLGELNELLWSHGYLYNKRYGSPETAQDTTFVNVVPWNKEK